MVNFLKAIAVEEGAVEVVEGSNNYSNTFREEKEDNLRQVMVDG